MNESDKEQVIDLAEAARGEDAATRDEASRRVSAPPRATSSIEEGEEIERSIRRRSRRGFLVSGVAALAGFGGWRWLATRRGDDGIPWPLRRAHEINEQLARDYFQGSRLAPAFARQRARMPRVNGEHGLDEEFDPATWKLRVLGLEDASGAEDAAVASLSAWKEQHGASVSSASNDASHDSLLEDTPRGEALLLSFDHIKALPRVEMVTELKCIEGWSEIVHWTGARLADFAGLYQPATRGGDAPEDLIGYVSLETPDGGYYVGLDMASALHPQTLLCYEMNGAPLEIAHGAPLRLVIPVKYGIKSIKGIGTISFTDKRPADYWAERGYDWYAGH
ncbi:MAG: molybdopterin-dependent oxidoreductase [Blastocatellia bacterium]